MKRPAVGPGAGAARVGRVLAAAVAALFLGACGGDGDPSGTATVVLFDLSGSTAADEVRDAYCQNFGQVLEQVEFGDALAAGWIVESSVSQPVLPVDTVIPSFDPGTTNPLIEEAERVEADSLLALARDSLQARVCRRLQRPGARTEQTDIFTSLDLAADILEARSGEREVLVIMSDMIEDSDRYQFDEMTLDSTRRAAILRRELRRMPDLEGVKVCVVGASNSDVERYYRVERFWTAYFDSAGANLARYGAPYIGC